MTRMIETATVFQASTYQNICSLVQMPPFDPPKNPIKACVNELSLVGKAKPRLAVIA